MWKGGVRVIVLDDENRILMVKQDHPERVVWMVPGGGIEEGENSLEAGVREIKEETGLDIEVQSLLWHVQEVGERGQRFVDFLLAKPVQQDSSPKLGRDPEFEEDGQVLREVKFMDRHEMADLKNLYPEWLRDEFWEKLDAGQLNYNAFKIREKHFPR